MKCRLTKLVLFLLLGAIINVAVAWGFAAFGGAVPFRKANYKVLPVEQASTYWLAHTPVEWHDAVHRTGNAVESWALGRNEILVYGEPPGSENKKFRWSLGAGSYQTGWPMRTMTAEDLVSLQNEAATTVWKHCWHL